jgi:hypothetical protein
VRGGRFARHRSNPFACKSIEIEATLNQFSAGWQTEIDTLQNKGAAALELIGIWEKSEYPLPLRKPVP